MYNTTDVNPLDHVEDVLHNNNWVFSRLNNDQLTVDVIGAACGYRLLFVWSEKLNAMQLYCQYDFEIHETNKNSVSDILMKLNESLWMGHFELTKSTNHPCYRQTCLLRGYGNQGEEYIEDLVDISLALCEKSFAVFKLLSSDTPPSAEALSLAMMDTAGES